MATARSEYIETESGTRISRKSHVKGAQYIVIGGKTLIQDGVVLRGDLHNPAPAQKGLAKSIEPIIALGKYSILRSRCVLTPPQRTRVVNASPTSQPADLADGPARSENGPQTETVFSLLKVGSYTYIGPDSKIEAAIVGSCVYAGKNVCIGRFAIIKDCVVIEDGTVVPPFAVIPPFSRIAGTPARVVDRLPDSAPEVMELFARKYYTGIDVRAPFLDTKI